MKSSAIWRVAALSCLAAAAAGPVLMMAADAFPQPMNMLLWGLLSTIVLSPIAVIVFFWFGYEFNKALDEEEESKTR